jgi:E3 ubiquitin-protein ligase HUWE1
MLNNDISNVIFQTFSAEVEEFGEMKNIDLIENGSNINVTNENKEEYIKLFTHQKMTTSIKSQLFNFLESFYLIIPQKLISIFNESELELLISGCPDIDIHDLEKNTEYTGYSKNDQVIRDFWKVLYKLNKEEKALLIQFVTGTSKVPVGGFKNLVGSSGPQKFNVHKVYGNTNRLPTSHTCFNQLDLPQYKDEFELYDRLLLAIKEGSEGFGFV